MTPIETAKFITDLGTTGVLLVILWQGLKRFDKLLDLVITLAGRASLSKEDIETVRSQVFGKNGRT